MKKILRALSAMLLLAMLAVPAHAVQEDAHAKNVSGTGIVSAHSGFFDITMLFDGRTTIPVPFENHASLTLSCPEGIGALYLIFDLEYGSFTVTDSDSGEKRFFGENGFLHEFADLEQAFGRVPQEVEITFESGTGMLNELSVYTPGAVPESVQIWEAPKNGETDIVLFSAHGDDEQLFFAGLLPYYAAERGLQVQVVYMTDHRNTTNVRAHEMLNGLWAVGVRNYPVFGSFPDLLTNSTNQTLMQFQSRGITEEEVLEFVVAQLRRFHPLVAVGHDLQGEYGHGQHMLYAELLTRAVQISNDPAYFPESAEMYGVWDVPKTYLHLYPDNRIYLDWDQPLMAFDGMTAFQVTQKLGYPCHETQYWDFAWYLSYAQTAASIEKYSPCEYGLYRSLVGQDALKNDLMENLTSHAQRKAEEEAARLAAEEEARRQEKLKQEQLRKEEEERLRLEAIQREKEWQHLQLQQEAAQQELQRRNVLSAWAFCGALTVLVLLGTIAAGIDRKNNFSKK